MFKGLLQKLKNERDDGTEKEKHIKSQFNDDESKIDALSDYLISKFSYDKESVKIVLTNIYKGNFNVENPKHRQEFIATLRGIIRLETVNKYNTLFIDASGHERGPLVVLSDMAKIRLNPSLEAAAFITMDERVLVEQFNEEATNADF